MIKAVIDTNVFVSGLIGSGSSSDIIDSLANDEFKLVISYSLLGELLFVLNRPKFRKYFDYRDVKELASLIHAKTKLISPSVTIQVCRDPKDNFVIECAVTGKADFIVTGDNDLLCLIAYREIPIVSPNHFLKVLKPLR